MKITKEALGNLILEEIQKLEEKPSPQARRQKKREAKAKRRQARKEKAASPNPQGKPQQKPGNPQAAAKDAAQQAKKTEKATTKAGLQKATGEKVDTSEQPEEIQKVSGEIEKLQKRLQSWANKTISKVPKTDDAAADKAAKVAIMKIPMALKVANQSIDKISKEDNESLQAVLDGEEPSTQGEEAEEPAANRREVEEAVIFDLSEFLKNEM
tara:strand:- start:1731 stop:2366 length:636 start_codon:yes stop_codon:yes gene_type:complete